MIPAAEYKKIIGVIPIICVDIIVINESEECLLIKRAKEPLKGQWWVIGGRVIKGETLEEAAIRKVAEETSLKISAPIAIGYYEDTKEKNPFGDTSHQHSISIVFTATAQKNKRIKLDNQSRDWGYFKELPDTFDIKPFITK